jgi:predicted RNase H-like HicB family nuclease
MERLIRVHVERLPEGVFLASSDDVQGLVAQGRTISETLEIARDVARRLLEAQTERHPVPESQPIAGPVDLTLVVGAERP